MKKILIFTLLTLLSLTSCQEKTGETAASAATKEAHDHEEAPPDVVELNADQVRLGEVKLGSVEVRSLGQALTVSGRLAVPAQSILSLTAVQGGFVRSLPLLPGQRVRKGQVLARIENGDLIQIQQELAENQSRLTYLESEFTRQKELSEQAVSALKVFQQTTADLAVTKARITGLSQRLRRVGISPEAALRGEFSAFYVVTAPQAGVVTDVRSNPGQYVQPTDVLATLTGSEGLYAELAVFERDLPQVREGQRVTLRLSNEAGRERGGRVFSINRAIDTDRTVRVLVRPDQPDARLLPNTFLKASLDLGESKVTALPEGAIVSAEGKDYIFVLTEEKAEEHHHEEGEKHEAVEEKEGPHAAFKRLLVRRGVTENGYSQVMLPSTLNPATTRVVVQGAYALLSQLKAAGGEEEGHHH